MKKILLVFIINFLLSGSFGTFCQTGDEAWRTGEKQILISADYFNYVKRLKLSYDYLVSENSLRVYAVPSEISLLESSGVPYVVEIEDLNNYKRDFWILEEQYHTYQEIINLADSLEQNFGSICKKYTFGSSIGGRQCAALKISDNVQADENEPEVMFDGGIHGDEVGGSENIIRFARDLCIKYGTDPVVTELINSREIWLYLMVNPDGRQNNSRYNLNFVDLNRDWGYMWDGEGGSPAAFSQVETRALRNCMYGNQFVVHTTFHSGTLFISYPWSYRPNQCLDYNHIHQLAGVYASTSGYGSSLPYAQGYSGMYPINGSTKDGNYGIMGSVSWSLEISLSKHPPNSQIMQYYNWNYPSMLALIRYSGYGIEGTVTDALTGMPVPAVIYINNYYPAYSDPSVGDYHKYVLPGTYSVTAKANGYETQTLTNITVSPNSSAVVDFQLQPGSGYYGYRLSACVIPNNNFSDEGLTYAALGAPDNKNYSLGKNGWCIIDLQTAVQNITGMDIKIYEGDSSPEGYYCYAGMSIDGPWTLLGAGTGTAEFDIASLEQAKFIKIVDDGDGLATAADAGFDLDAVQSLHPVPVELTSFTALQNQQGILISWTTASELNNFGFDLQRTDAGNEWISIAFIPGNGTTNEKHQYSYQDKKPPEGINYYRLRQTDFNGNSRTYFPIEAEFTEVKEYSLFQNYPNPFNPSTKIIFSVPREMHVQLILYDMLGRETAVLLDEMKQAGKHEIIFNSAEYSTGIYFYTIKSGEYFQTRKMVILK